MKTGTRHDAALVVFSGGQDSTTCLFWAKEHFAEVRALTFLYGQKHREEVNVAQRIARTADVAWDVLDASFIASLGTSALTDTRILMDSEKPAEGPPNTFVPGRNLFFLSMAAVYAAERGIRHLVTGVSETDFSGYPDCRDTFVRSLNVTLDLAMDAQFVIHTPLMWLDKADVWALSDRLGVFDLVRRETLTCYNGVLATVVGIVPLVACAMRDWSATSPDAKLLPKYTNSKKARKHHRLTSLFHFGVTRRNRLSLFVLR